MHQGGVLPKVAEPPLNRVRTDSRPHTPWRPSYEPSEVPGLLLPSKSLISPSPAPGRKWSLGPGKP